MIADIAKSFTAAKKKYDRGQNALGDALALGKLCLTTLGGSATLRKFGEFAGPPALEYWVAEDAGVLSRPYRPDLFIDDPERFETEAAAFVSDMQNGGGDPTRFDQVVYTTVSAFCLCYDVWKPKSRKR